MSPAAAGEQVNAATAGMRSIQQGPKLDLLLMTLISAAHWQAHMCNLVTTAVCMTPATHAKQNSSKIMPHVCSTCLYVPFSYAQRAKLRCHAAIWQQHVPGVLVLHPFRFKMRAHFKSERV